jgi:ATP-binding protein involved in chromosome partitioning
MSRYLLKFHLHLHVDIKLREGGDEGSPIVFRDPESDAAKGFFAIVDQLTKRKKSLVGVPLGVST